MAMTLAGCVLDTDAGEGDDAVEVDEATEAVVSANGTSLNGTSLNGTSLNGTSLNGQSLNGTSLNGTSLNGTSLNGVTLNATNFSGTLNGQPVSNWVGAKFTATLSGGSTVAVRIDSKTTLAAPNTDVSAYGVSYQTSTGWAPLCGVSTTLAIPINGTFNNGSGVVGGGSFTPSTTAFTFACRATAIAKCVELGYKPWKTVGGTLLQNHMVACTRLLRADFCGDGKSWTVDGTQINLYDDKGIQTDTVAWLIEAEWNQNGAIRVNTSKETRWSLNAGKPPACYTAKVDKTNTGKLTNFATGTLLMNEYLQ
ncbi:MAG: ADYC domain-containing protein [Polyangiaceae bacterium]